MRVIDLNLVNVLIIGLVAWLFHVVMGVFASRWPNKVFVALAA